MCQNDECSGIKAERVVILSTCSFYSNLQKKTLGTLSRLGDQQQSSSTLNCYYMYYIQTRGLDKN